MPFAVLANEPTLNFLLEYQNRPQWMTLNANGGCPQALISTKRFLSFTPKLKKRNLEGAFLGCETKCKWEFDVIRLR